MVRPTIPIGIFEGNPELEQDFKKSRSCQRRRFLSMLRHPSFFGVTSNEVSTDGDIEKLAEVCLAMGLKKLDDFQKEVRKTYNHRKVGTQINYNVKHYRKFKKSDWTDHIDKLIRHTKRRVLEKVNKIMEKFQKM